MLVVKQGNRTKRNEAKLENTAIIKFGEALQNNLE
jgi:hypothetical protein